MMSRLSEMPVEVFLDNLLPFMQIADILRLGRTNKTFAAICSDDTFWKRRLETDFRFPGANTARTNGWKFIYRGLFNPRVYVWGNNGNSRLGLLNVPRSFRGGVPLPTRLVVPGARLVSLVAGGWSFHALDSEGHIHVWGTLNGESFIMGDGFIASGKPAKTPLKLDLPATMRSISCGRSHAASLDTNNRIWNFVNWGHPFWLSSSLLRDPTSKPVQIECGWMFSCMLTQYGDVFVWWPFSGQMETRIQSEMNGEGAGNTSSPRNRNGAIPCVPWELDLAPTRLPSIPALPDLSSGTNSEQPTQLIKVAGLDNLLIGLTNKGHVLAFESLHNETSASNGHWQYLPKFSEVHTVRELLVEHGIEPPHSMRMTHISANYEHFFAYSIGASSIVLKGDTSLEPKIIPGLQNKSVISVIPGDHHYVALTMSGKVLTWGVGDKGALGLGNPALLPPGAPGGYSDDESFNVSEVKVPTEVRFDHGRASPNDRFCFSIAAAGWHTGALVIDLEHDDDSDEEEMTDTGRSTAPAVEDRPRVGQMFPILSPFRIGFAGRGMRGGFGRGGPVG